MKFATMDQVKAGTILVADDGFTCIAEHSECEVKERPDGVLYIDCHCGQHVLDGQLDGKTYVGLWLASDYYGGNTT